MVSTPLEIANEKIITGPDAVSVNMLRQIYSALKDRSPENLNVIETCWVKSIEEAFQSNEVYKEYLVDGLNQLLVQASDIFTQAESSSQWDAKSEQLYDILEKLVFSKAKEDVFKEFFSACEQAIFAMLRLDFTKKVIYTDKGGKRDIFNYLALILNITIETMAKETISAKAANLLVSRHTDTIAIITDENGNIRFINDLGIELLGVDNYDLIQRPIKTIFLNYEHIHKTLLQDGYVKEMEIKVLGTSKEYTGTLDINKPRDERRIVGEFVYFIRLNEL
jgi:PAS domain-containing protein